LECILTKVQLQYYEKNNQGEATEAIIDTALKFNKPFAVVPCCVFNRLFPERRTKDGQEVVTYPEFITYLMEKDPRIEFEYLGCEGRNKVLFVRP
jgi:hypothetical protein